VGLFKQKDKPVRRRERDLTKTLSNCNIIVTKINYSKYAKEVTK